MCPRSHIHQQDKPRQGLCLIHQKTKAAREPATPQRLSPSTIHSNGGQHYDYSTDDPTIQDRSFFVQGHLVVGLEVAQQGESELRVLSHVAPCLPGTLHMSQNPLLR